MEQVRTRVSTLDDIDRVIALERLWGREDIAYGDFNPMSREAYIAILERFGAYFLVAENGGQLVGYIHASVQRNHPVEIIPHITGSVGGCAVRGSLGSDGTQYFYHLARHGGGTVAWRPARRLRWC